MKNNIKFRHILLIIATAVLMITAIVITATAQINEKPTDISFSQQFKMGNLAVVDFNTTDGISLYSKSSVRHEKQSAENTVFTYEGADSSYPRVSNKDGIYISGTYDNSTVVFYIKETDNEEKSMSVKTKNINESNYFAGIKSDRITSSSVSMAVYNGDEILWRTIISDNTYDVVTTDIDYTDCPFDKEKNAYMIALRVDSGMTCFEGLQIAGLEIAEITDSRKTLFYKDGVLMQGAPDSENSVADAVAHFNFELIRNVTACTTNENNILNPVRPIITFLKNLYDFIVRLVNNVLSIYR